MNRIKEVLEKRKSRKSRKLRKQVKVSAKLMRMYVTVDNQG